MNDIEIQILGELSKETYRQMAKFRDAAEIAEKMGIHEAVTKLRAEAFRLLDLWNTLTLMMERNLFSEDKE